MPILDYCRFADIDHLLIFLHVQLNGQLKQVLGLRVHRNVWTSLWYGKKMHADAYFIIDPALLFFSRPTLTHHLSCANYSPGYCTLYCPRLMMAEIFEVKNWGWRAACLWYPMKGIFAQSDSVHFQPCDQVFLLYPLLSDVATSDSMLEVETVLSCN